MTDPLDNPQTPALSLAIQTALAQEEATGTIEAAQAAAQARTIAAWARVALPPEVWGELGFSKVWAGAEGPPVFSWGPYTVKALLGSKLSDANSTRILTVALGLWVISGPGITPPQSPHRAIRLTVGNPVKWGERTPTAPAPISEEAIAENMATLGAALRDLIESAQSLSIPF